MVLVRNYERHFLLNAILRNYIVVLYDSVGSIIGTADGLSMGNVDMVVQVRKVDFLLNKEDGI